MEESGDALCPATIKAWDDQKYGWTGNEIASGKIASGPGSDAAQTLWVICRGEPAGGVGVVAARSTDGQTWLTRELPIPPANHAGDDVAVDFVGNGRVSVTYDSLVAEAHRHVWTRDNGATWRALSDTP